MSTLKNIVRNTEKTFDSLKMKVKEAMSLFDPVFIYPYGGFGNQEVAYLHGRILEKEGVIHGKNKLEDSTWNNLRKVWKRYESDELPDVEVSGWFSGIKATTVSDDEGYFTLKFEGFNNNPLEDGWHPVQLEITAMPFDIEFIKEADGEILLNNQQDAAFGVISDIDDTIMVSHAMKPIKRVTTMLKNDGTSRVPFKGVGKLYKALSQENKNPMLFVSGSSYNLYDMLVSFIDHQKVPKAPLFLRDLGLGPKQWIKQDTKPYKLEHIERIFSVYNKLSFILIGDSGQEDPEIYLAIHKKYPGRVKAIYIRHVHTDERKKELEELAASVNFPFLIMDDSQEAYNHAQTQGWIR